MLFVSSQPVQVQILEDRKLIALTSTKIIFSHLDFIQEYLALPLINQHPSRMYYEPSVMQTMVVSDRAIEVYYTDWRTQIKLIRVLILNNEYVDTVSYEPQTGWHIFGSMAQYEPVRINFHKSSQSSTYLALCYIDHSKYTLTNQSLKKQQGLAPEREVLWKDRMMVVRNSGSKVVMKGAQTSDKKRDIIAINSTYIIVVSNFEVLNTIVENNIIYIYNSLLISHCDKQQHAITVQKYDKNNFQDLGTITKPGDCLCAAYLYENDLVILNYELKSLHMHSIQVSKELQNEKTEGAKFKLLQSISRIMEQSREQGSQLLSGEKDNVTCLPNSDQSQHFLPNEKPLIRDIVIDDEELKNNTLSDKSSEVLSRSGNYLEVENCNQELKQSNCQEEELLSFEIDQSNRENSKGNIYFRSVPLKKKKKQILRSSSLKNEAEETNLKSGITEDKKINVSIDSEGRSARKKGLSWQGMENSGEEFASTPVFGLETGWNSFQRKWTETNKNQIVEADQVQMEESICLEDEKPMMKSITERTSQKYQYFKPPNAIYSTDLFQKIERKSYCSLISKVLESEPNKLEQILDIFLINVLDEPEAQLLFEYSIRTDNPQLTQNKIRVLFKKAAKDDTLKEKITCALQLFKISEVPPQLISFPSDFIKVMCVICKDIYLEDVLHPSETTIAYILSSYFSIEKFNQEVIKIEDEEIDITHPRNMLNILLYLNEFLGLKIETIVQVYCSKLIQENHLDILHKILWKENIFEICEVPRSVLDQVVVERIHSMLYESVDNVDPLWNLIDYLTTPLVTEYRVKLAIISELNKCNIVYDMQTLLAINDTHNDLFTFLEKMFAQNSCRNLFELKISGIYRSFYWLQEKERLKHVTIEYIQLLKVLAEKFCEKQMFSKGFTVLEPVLHRVKTSFIAKLLKCYLKGKYINRLAESGKVSNFAETFPELMNPCLDITKLTGDQIQIPQFSNSLSCSFNKFASVFQKYLNQSIQVKVLTFCQTQIAQELFLTLDQNQQAGFSKFLVEIEDYLIVDLNQINEIESHNPKAQTSILFDDHIKDLDSIAASSTIKIEDVMIPEVGMKKGLVYKSMTIIDHFNNIDDHKLTRRNSENKYRNRESIIMHNDDLIGVKLLVSSKEIIEELRSIYVEKDQDIFLKCLKLIDIEKVELYRLDAFKAILYRNIEFSLKRIFPFDIFLTRDPERAFQIARQSIQSELNPRNFWVIYLVVQIIFSKGEEVALMFMNKCVHFFRNDDFADLLIQVLEIIKPRIPQDSLKNLIEEAVCYNLKQISQLFCSYKQKMNYLYK